MIWFVVFTLVFLVAGLAFRLASLDSKLKHIELHLTALHHQVGKLWDKVEGEEL